MEGREARTGSGDLAGEVSSDPLGSGWGEGAWLPRPCTEHSSLRRESPGPALS